MPQLEIESRAGGHQCSSVQYMGWSGITNGQLLTLAQDQFDVFLTGDRNLSFQQNVTSYRIAVVVLQASGTQLHQTLPLMPKVLAALPTLSAGNVIFIR